MPIGERALNPQTPYLVHEFLHGGKVFMSEWRTAKSAMAFKN